MQFFKKIIYRIYKRILIVFKYDNSRPKKLIKLYPILFFTKLELRALG